MKIKLFSLFVLLATVSIAQVDKDFIGTWTFQKIDTVDLDKKIPKTLQNSLIRMTRTMQLTFEKDQTYVSKVMGEETVGEYVVKGNKLITDNGVTISLISKNQIYCSSSEYMSFYMSRGSDILEKEYTYLSDTEYSIEPIQKNSLIGSWQVKEGRVLEDTELASKNEGIAAMLSMEFLKSDELKMKVMNISIPTEYSFTLKGNDLEILQPSGKKEKYVVYAANSERIILYKKEDSMYMYLEPELDEEDDIESTLLPLEKEYKPLAFNEELLYKKWSCIDARISTTEKDPELAKTIFQSFTFTFEPNDILILEFFGREQQRTWKKGEGVGELLLGVTDKPTLYIVNEISESHLIITLGKTGSVLYFQVEG